MVKIVFFWDTIEKLHVVKVNVLQKKFKKISFFWLKNVISYLNFTCNSIYFTAIFHIENWREWPPRTALYPGSRTNHGCSSWSSNVRFQNFSFPVFFSIAQLFFGFVKFFFKREERCFVIYYHFNAFKKLFFWVYIIML